MDQGFLLSAVKLSHLIRDPVSHDLSFVHLPSLALGGLIDSVTKNSHGLQFLLQYSILVDCYHLISRFCKIFDISRRCIGHIAGVRPDLLHLTSSP